MRAFPVAALLCLVLAITAAAPARAQTPVPTRPIDPFGQEVTLTAKPIVYIKGAGSPDRPLDSVVEAFKRIEAYLAEAGLTASGPPMMIYTSENFDYEAAIPLAEPPKNPPASPVPRPPGGDIAVGQSPAGRVLKFVHRGPYDELPQTYEAIANDLDGKGLDAGPPLIEEYVTDPAATPADQLVINVYASIR